MNGYSAIPASYQNGLYWQYFMKSFEDAMAMYNAKANAYQANAARTTAQQANNSYNTDAQAAANTQNVDSYNAAQTQAAKMQAASSALKPQKDGRVYVVADGKDDGKISGAQKFANFAKGVGNFFKGMVCGKCCAACTFNAIEFKVERRRRVKSTGALPKPSVTWEAEPVVKQIVRKNKNSDPSIE